MHIPVNIDITLRDENDDEIDLRDHPDAIYDLTQLFEKGDIVSIEELLGHLIVRINIERELLYGE